MAVITYPSLCVSSFRWMKVNQAMIFTSPFGSQAVDVSTPLWSVEMTGVPTKFDTADRIQTFLESLDGFRNQLALWNLARPVPKGTMRGLMVLGSPASQGDVQISISAPTEAGGTLLEGDLLGIGSGLTQQVVRVMADATADISGDILVTIGTPLRNSFLAGDPVVWDKPKALFRQTAITDGIEYVPGIANAWSLQLVEDIRP